MPIFNWFQIGASAILTAVLAWGASSLYIDGLEADQRAALAKQATELNKKCDDDKQITQEAQNALQKNYSIIAARLAASKRMHPASCIVPSSVKANHAASGGQYAGQNGLSTEWLEDFAAECETYRTQRIILEQFIDETWKESQP